MNTYADHAEKFFERGLIPIPVDQLKRPIPTEWQKTTKESFPNKYWEWVQKHGAAQVGILCGKESGITVFDLDLDENNPTEKLILDRIKPFLPVSEVCQVSRKGDKRFFRYNGEKSKSLRLKINGEYINVFDLLSDGKQVVVSPSIQVHDGQTYRYKDLGAPLADIDVNDLPIIEPGLIETLVKEAKALELSNPWTPKEKQTTGRNNALKDQITVALHKGKTLDQISTEIVYYDRLHHSPPLFEDPSEKIQGATPLEKSHTLIKNIAKTLGIDLKAQPVISDFKMQNGLKAWGPIKPISSLGSPYIAESFTEDMIPAPWRDWITNSAKRAAVPLEMIAVPAMVSFSALVGAKVQINLHPDGILKTTANLWGALVREVSERKTTSLRLGLECFNIVNDKLELENEAAAARTIALLKQIDLQCAALDKEYLEVLKNNGNTSVITNKRIKLEEERKTLKRTKRLQVRDATVEAFQMAMVDNPNGLLLFNDEIMSWIAGMGRMGRESERHFFNECWNGTLKNAVGLRIGRDNFIIPRLIASVLGGIQPGPLTALVKKAMDGSVDSDGFLQRFQLMVYPDGDTKSTLTSRLEQATYNKARARDTYRKAYDYTPEYDDDNETRTVLTLSPEAQERFFDWAKELEKKVGNKDLSKPFAEHISKFATLLSRLTLNIHLIKQFDQPQRSDFTDIVHIDQLEMAIEWCRVLETHAKKIYGIVKTSLKLSSEKLIKMIKEGKITDGITLRQIQRKNLRGLETIEQIKEACSDLEEIGILQLDESQIGKTRGPKSIRIFINPVIFRDGES